MTQQRGNESREEWISEVAAAIRRALNDPAVRAEIVTLLCGEEERRQRRLAELATELQRMESTMRVGDGTDDENR
jgi:hypothetical protein